MGEGPVDRPPPPPPPEPPLDLSAVSTPGPDRSDRWTLPPGGAPDYQPISAVDAAMTAQGDDRYPGVDAWRNEQAVAGDRVWFGAPGISGFGVLEGDLMDVGYDAQAYNEGVQARPLDGEYRPQLQCYEFTRSCDIAVGTTESNPQYGAGGFEQCFVPDVQARFDDGTLAKLGELEMTNRNARIVVA